jgi:hypothetical protein
MHSRGEISFEDFEGVTAIATLRQQGIIDPTPEQVGRRISELSTAASFVGSIDG